VFTLSRDESTTMRRNTATDACRGAPIDQAQVPVGERRRALNVSRALSEVPRSGKKTWSDSVRSRAPTSRAWLDRLVLSDSLLANDLPAGSAQAERPHLKSCPRQDGSSDAFRRALGLPHTDTGMKRASDVERENQTGWSRSGYFDPVFLFAMPCRSVSSIDIVQDPEKIGQPILDMFGLPRIARPPPTSENRCLEGITSSDSTPSTDLRRNLKRRTRACKSSRRRREFHSC